MSQLRAAAQQALEALCLPCSRWNGTQSKIVNDAIDALRAALAEPVKEPEPAGWFEGPFGEFRANPLHRIAWPAQTVAWSIPLYLAPPQRPAEPVQSFEDEQRAINAEEHRRALAEPVQEPVGYFSVNDYGRWEENENEYGEPLYTAPPQRKPLTQEEIINIGKEAHAVEGPHILPVTFARAIERAHGIGSKA